MTVKVASCAMARPFSVTGVASQSASGPAMPSRQPSIRLIQGTTWP